MIPYSRRAAKQVDDLIAHYVERQRPEAVRSLRRALHDASAEIERNPTVGLAAPRPYPALARPESAWLKAGRYWIAYRRRPTLMITAVFYDAADIPGRF